MSNAIMLHRVTARYPKYDYTGSSEFIDDGNGNWRIKFKTDGELTFTRLGNARKGIDVFLVGGGAGGTSWVSLAGVGASGGAGYTFTDKTGNIKPEKGTAYSIDIGDGGAKKSGSGGSQGSTIGNAGKKTTAFDQTANGGGAAECGYTTDGGESFSWAHGGHGGSGGGTGSGNGGENGGNGVFQGAEVGYAGTGQGRTTAEFEEDVPGVTKYAKGGGNDTSVSPNSGNGGKSGSNGSSGIVVIRNHR